jgi:hypothetical protein
VHDLKGEVILFIDEMHTLVGAGVRRTLLSLRPSDTLLTFTWNRLRKARWTPLTCSSLLSHAESCTGEFPLSLFAF